MDSLVSDITKLHASFHASILNTSSSQEHSFWFSFLHIGSGTTLDNLRTEPYSRQNCQAYGTCSIHIDIENLRFGVGDGMLRLLREPTQLAHFETVHQMRSHFTLNKISVTGVMSMQ